MPGAAPLYAAQTGAPAGHVIDSHTGERPPGPPRPRPSVATRLRLLAEAAEPFLPLTAVPNRNYYNAPSPIHGTGVFAARRIPRGELIGVYTGVTTKRDSTYVLWVEWGEGRTVGRLGRSGLRFLNHSSRPNAEFDGDRLYARRVIRKDEEITFHYGEEWADEP